MHLSGHEVALALGRRHRGHHRQHVTAAGARTTNMPARAPLSVAVRPDTLEPPPEGAAMTPLATSTFLQVLLLRGLEALVDEHGGATA